MQRKWKTVEYLIPCLWKHPIMQWVSSAGKGDPEGTWRVALQECICPSGDQCSQRSNKLHRFKDLKTERFGSVSSALALYIHCSLFWFALHCSTLLLKEFRWGRWTLAAWPGASSTASSGSLTENMCLLEAPTWTGGLSHRWHQISAITDAYFKPKDTAWLFHDSLSPVGQGTGSCHLQLLQPSKGPA